MAIRERGLSAEDARAVRIMRASLNSGLPDNPLEAAYGEAPVSGRCADARHQDVSAEALRQDLNACFATIGNHLQFEGHAVPRDSAITLLGQLSAPERRKALFLAFTPLWEAVNGHDEPDSPYRRRIRAAADDARVHGSGIDAAAMDLGLTATEAEHWLVRILETWRDVTPATPVEPWDYRYMAGAADRALSTAINRAGLLPTVKHYYRDLGLDLNGIGVLFDLAPRAGKAPVTYANYITMGRQDGAGWRPTRSRISANFSDSGLYVLNMLVHESAHSLHFEAIHNRPAFMDIGDGLFCESFADVASWSVYEPAWQKKYLGQSVSEEAGLRSLYTMVTLESAWALFEMRMLRRPDASPNVVWTDITREYLHVIAHPEYAWWAQRVQLVKHPGFMANYGLGAAVTADIRQRIRTSLGPFAAGDPRWYPWVSQRLLRTGVQFDTAQVLHQFLGRPVSVEPLLEEIRRIQAVPAR